MELAAFADELLRKRKEGGKNIITIAIVTTITTISKDEHMHASCIYAVR